MAEQRADYIIVGAGSAGCVLAGRLTEDGSTSVLLLEAGGVDKRRELRIPAAFSKLFKTECDWNFTTEPQSALGGRRLYWPRGKVLGGSSSINAMVYSRPDRRDQDHWAGSGNPGWSFAEVLPYYKKSEHFAAGASEFHGAGGPLHVAPLRCTNPLSQVFLDAAGELGYARNDDFNGAEQLGVGMFHVTQRNGRRCSAADAFLKPAQMRSNLAVETDALITRIIIEGDRALGIEFARGGKIQRATANREVLLCAGTVNSPQLLQLSGIGNADNLKALGISVAQHLPGVGQNLQDHPVMAQAYECKQPISMADAESARNFVRYLCFGSGPLTSNIAEAGGFAKLKSASHSADIEFLFAPVFYMEHGFANPEGHGFSLGVVLQHPESRGCVRLRSACASDAPAIEANYLCAESDLRTLIEGVKIVREIARAKAFAPFYGKELWPGDAVQSDAQIAEFIRQRVETIYHTIGTCKMGHDSLAVVDSEFRVHGVRGLRVIDASVIPTQMTGNTNAVVMMLAEKAADLLT